MGAIEITAAGGGGISQTDADARYVALDGSSTGALSQQQKLTKGLTVGALGTDQGVITFYDTSGAHSVSFRVATSSATPRQWQHVANFTGNRTFTWPDATGTLALLSNKLSAFAATSSSELAGVISDEIGSGFLVFNRAPITAVTADYVILVTDSVITVDATGGNVTLTLPDAASAIGQCWRIKRLDGSVNSVTIARSGGNTIDGGTTTTLVTQYSSKDIITLSVSTFGVF